jgi:hypothetical protein
MLLNAVDLAAFAKLGIDLALLERHRVRRVSDQEARDALGLNGRRGDLSGILFPYIWPGETHAATHRLRRDHPEIDATTGRAKDKYLSGCGDRKHVFVVADGPGALADVSIQLVLVEAEKSALSVASAAARLGRRIVVMATGGCWGWRSKNVGKVLRPDGSATTAGGIVPDFDRVVWTDRDVIVAFDANAATNPTVQDARRALVYSVLRPRRAKPRILDLPVEPNVNGPDDYVAAHGDAALFALVDAAETVGVRLEDFRAYMPMHSYIFMPTGELWPASAVNARLPPVPLVDRTGAPIFNEGRPKTSKPSVWLDTHRAVEQMTWLPGRPSILVDTLVSDGGWIDRLGCHVFNLYRRPTIERGNPDQAAPWLSHLFLTYPEDAEHILAWLAHRVQRPEEKINHALVLGGAQGIGKDTILEPVKHAIGPWNFTEISPAHLLGRFNGFAKSVILRISEARDLGEVDRYSFYDRSKIYIAAPPDVLRVDEKHLREYSVWNVCGVIITTNHRTDGLYLPADDRRHYVAWSPQANEAFTADYWTDLYGWYGRGGTRHVAAYLATYDLRDFDPKAPPPKTRAFWDIVDASRVPEDADLADALDRLGYPAALTLADLAGITPSEFSEWLKDRKHARQVPHRLEQTGYVAVRNPTAKDGLWKVDGRRQVVYAQCHLSMKEQFAAAFERVNQ